jgi:hypothetical protein
MADACFMQTQVNAGYRQQETWTHVCSVPWGWSFTVTFTFTITISNTTSTETPPAFTTSSSTRTTSWATGATVAPQHQAKHHVRVD